MSIKTPENKNSQTCPTVEYIDPRRLIPSPENSKVYKPVNRNDLAIQQLSRDIEENGILEPLVVSADRYIISGHRRREASILAGLEVVPCRIEANILHNDPEFLPLLVSHNAQRTKNRAELLREAIIKTNPDEAYRALIEHRERQSGFTAEAVKVSRRGCRKKISPVKADMVQAAIGVINQNRQYWPLSDRQIHYRLLNSPPLKNTENPQSRYCNDRKSYQDLCDLLTRLRLTGRIPMHSIDDTTRSTTDWYVHESPQSFAQRELDDLLKGYRRSLQQSQHLHLEIIAEKLTVESIIRPVCGKYNVPYTIGRGYSSLPARHKIVQRFERSGKDRLLILVVSDFDADGVAIGETLLQSLREDFGAVADAVRVGLNLEQVERFGLIDNSTVAKKSSPQYQKFIEKYGRQARAYELEAMRPEQLQLILSEAINQVIDIEAFNTELEAEKFDAAYLQAVRERICEAARELLAGGDDE